MFPLRQYRVLYSTDARFFDALDDFGDTTQAAVRYKVWIVLGSERLELLTTYADLELMEGGKKMARKVMRHLRERGKCAARVEGSVGLGSAIITIPLSPSLSRKLFGCTTTLHNTSAINQRISPDSPEFELDAEIYPDSEDEDACFTRAAHIPF